MERLYDQVKKDFDDKLKSKLEDIVNQNHFPYASENLSKDCFVTFFASNQDINIPKKKLSKYKLAHPTLKFSYSLERYADFYKVKTILSDTSNNNSEVIKTFPMFLFSQELEPKWRNEIISRVHYWINTIFAQTMLMYKDIYSITLALFMIEMYIESPDKMYITKFPSFQDLTFVTSDHPPKVLDNEEIISRQVSSIENSPFFKRG